MNELFRECRAILRHWLVGVVAITLVTAICGSIFIPAASASAGSRAFIALVGAVVGLLIVFVLVLAVALIRIPLSEHRERHQLRRIGQECSDVACEMIDQASFLRPSPDQLEFDDQEGMTSLGRYNTTLAARVFRTARALERFDVIDREKREGLATPPDDAFSYLQRVNTLLDLANRLGAEHPPNPPAVRINEAPKP